MRTRTLKIASISIAVTTLALASALTAQATRTVKIASHVTIHSKGLTFSGKVTASNPGCKGARRVTIYRGNPPGSALKTTTTSASGRWKITVPGSAGISLSPFYARVKQRSEGAAGTIYVCRGAQSKTIRVKP